MSFKCEGCGVAQPVGTRPINKVVAIREKKNGRGTEIAKEIRLCESCSTKSETTAG